MSRAYRILAWLIAGLVAVQGAMVAYFGSGVNRYIDGGGVIDRAMVESAQAGGAPPFPELIGVVIHGLNGGIVIPVVALILLGVSFGTKRAGARKWAGIVFALVFIQVNLGFAQGGMPLLGLLHGSNALLLFAAALQAGRLVGRGQPVPSTQSQASLV